MYVQLSTTFLFLFSQVTDKRDEALEELSSLTGVALSSPVSGTEPVPERLKIDPHKLKQYLDCNGFDGHG